MSSVAFPHHHFLYVYLLEFHAVANPTFYFSRNQINKDHTLYTGNLNGSNNFTFT
uniref:Uncharacterized protein n=1 Tax=Anguilla anguilla TaxID=7936 RepID=A0A0E9QP39_ANGAN